MEGTRPSAGWSGRHRLWVIAGGAVAAIVTAVALVFLWPGADEAPALPELGRAEGGSDEARSLAEPLGRFGFDLLACQAAASDENIVISPASIHAALSMLLNGARGETAEEIRRALQVEELDLATLNQAWADLITSAQAGEGSKLSIADSLWLRNGVPFDQGFLDLNRDYYAAELSELADDPAAAADTINQWIDERTRGKISKLYETIDPLTVLVLVSTVYLKVGWEHFEEEDTKPLPFTLTDDEQVDVDTMHGWMEAPVALHDEFNAVMLETDGPVDVWIIVPKGAETPESVVEALRERGLAGLYEEAVSLDGDLLLPRLSLTYTAEQLRESLEGMGMERAFDQELAQFEGVAAISPLWVEKVSHKATLDLNEEGVEAAAVTGVVMDGSAMPVDTFSIAADRPFLVALAESGSQAPLFLSLIRDPR